MRLSHCAKGGIRQFNNLALALVLAALPACAQYPGQVAKASKEAPVLRSIAVLEWTGEAGNPKASRLVPVVVLDQGQLQDGAIYLARPQPLAVAGEVEYELEQNGQPIGLFDIKNAGQEQGSWVGYGAWKPLGKPQPKPTAEELAHIKIDDDDAESDRPILHRKHHADEEAAGENKADAPPASTSTTADPDRPTLHKKSTSESDSADAAAEAKSSNNSNPALDPDRPTLHKKNSSDSTTAGSTPDDPDRPVLKKSRKKPLEDVSHVDSLADMTDPDRPRLKRGKANGNGLEVLPSLMGMPTDLQQAVAISDAKPRIEHPWRYSWANPEDEAAMKASLEVTARALLGLDQPPPVPATSRTASHRKAKADTAPDSSTLPVPAPLIDEDFRVFELAYNSGATLVLTARTGAPPAEQKFVTLIAQPDLYGSLTVLFKYVASGAHLDDTPRMRLIDAVDALADNRGELLFELRGATQRQFVLYRILRGEAEKLFVSGEASFASSEALFNSSSAGR
ncbi:MAG TPA: hypothetical protein VGF01_20030 [Terracidiphilus sp.]|jgi:hypothetical protein